MKKIFCGPLLLSLLSACGGGGGASGSGNQMPPAPAPVTPTVNAADALAAFLRTDRSISGLASNDGYLGTATLIVRTEESYPFVTNGKSQATATTKVFQFQEEDADGRLRRQQFWKLHLDASMRPVGMALGDSSGKYLSCHSVNAAAALPGATSGSGALFSGVQGYGYAETSRNGSYAHYCDPGSGTETKVEWSVQQGTPNPYFCLTMPDINGTPLTKICTVIENGVPGTALFIRRYKADGTSAVDYRSISANRPVEPAPGPVNERNYWYGTVWRPQDGYVYQRYEQTTFATEQACRDQTVIDWKATYSAVNIGWSCVNVTRN